MTFVSLEFVALFLGMYAMLMATHRDTARRWILLMASFLFYAYWNVWFTLLMLAVIIWSWICGLLIASSTDLKRRKAWVAVGVVFSLLVLGIFKYAVFIADNLATISGQEIPAFILEIGLPVGISFYTFHSISYYVDVYRNHTPAVKSLRDYSLYIAFFPQLVAGPIVRASFFLPQLARPVSLTRTNLVAGLRLVLFGAAQKLLLADQVSPFVDRVFGEPALYSGGTIGLAVLAYAVQIFGDFSGYTLMAIGFARVLGYELPENFRMPYISTSIVEFWQRWHITLSRFLRDYLYIPLGGNRGGFSRTQLNVLITMLLGGLWHGASWNFVLWGALHGSAIVVCNVWTRVTGGQAMWRPVGWTLTVGFVVLAWIPFRAIRLEDSVDIFSRMFTLAPGVEWFHTPTLVVLSVFVTWHVLHWVRPLLRHSPNVRMRNVLDAGLITMLVLLAPVESSPFIYFQF